MKKYYYAISYSCGVATDDTTGDRYGTYHRFSSLASRREWVDSGGDIRSNPDYREPIRAGDSEIRALLRAESREGIPLFITH